MVCQFNDFKFLFNYMTFIILLELPMSKKAKRGIIPLPFVHVSQLLLTICSIHLGQPIASTSYASQPRLGMQTGMILTFFSSLVTNSIFSNLPRLIVQYLLVLLDFILELELYYFNVTY